MKKLESGAKAMETEGKSLIASIEDHEPGIAELAALYERIESVYVAASQAMPQEIPFATVSDSTNS